MEVDTILTQSSEVNAEEHKKAESFFPILGFNNIQIVAKPKVIHSPLAEPGFIAYNKRILIFCRVLRIFLPVTFLKNNCIYSMPELIKIFLSFKSINTFSNVKIL